MAALLVLGACKTGDDLNVAQRGDVPPTTLAQVSDEFVDLSSGTTQVPLSAAASSSGAYLAAQSAIVERDMSAASDYLLVAMAADSGNKDLMRQTHFALISAGRIPEALPIARRLLVGEGGDQFSPLTVVADALDRNAFDEAEEALMRLPITGYNAILAPILEAWVAAGRGDYDEALAALDPTEMGDGFDALRSYHLALILDLAGRSVEVEEAFILALESQAGGAYRVVLGYGGLLERLGRPEDARAVYENFLAANPESLWLEGVLARLGGTGTPRVHVDEAREGAAEAMFAVASSAHQSDEPEIALAYGQLAAYLQPQNDVVSLLIGDILESQGKHLRAIDAYRRISADSPLDWTARLRVALNLDDAGQSDQAIALLRHMAEERPDRGDAMIVLGDILRVHERWTEAVEAYDEAFALRNPQVKENWRLLYVRAIALERSGDWDRAERDFLAALEVEPNHPFVLNYLGYTWVDRGENLERALEMIESAVNQRPLDGFIIDSLGWAYYRLGRFEDAVIQLELAVEYEPGDPVLNDHLGDAYWMVGRRAEARFQWRRAMSLGEDDPELIEAIGIKLQYGLDDGSDI